MKKKIEARKKEMDREASAIRPEDFADYIVIPPNGGWGWVVMIACFLSNFIVDGIIYSFGIFIVEIGKDLKAESRISMANSVLSGLYLLMGPVVCAMCNRLGFIVVGVLGGSLGCIGLVAASYAQDINEFVCTFGVMLGIGFSMTYISNVLVVGFYFDSLRPLTTAIAVTGTSIGTVFMGPFFNIMLVKYKLSWRQKFQILAAGSLFVALLGFTFRPIRPQRVLRVERPPVESPEEESKDVNKMHNTQYPTNAELGAGRVVELTINEILGVPNVDTGSQPSISTFTGADAGSTLSFISSWLGGDGDTYSDRPNCCKRCLGYCCFMFCCGSTCHIQQRPMYKDDILYTGRIKKLHHYDNKVTEVSTNHFHF